MKRISLVAHLSVPALVTMGTFAAAIRREPFGVEMFFAYVLGGYLFYAAPHLLWAVVAALARFSNAMWHAGFIAASVALAAIASLWLVPGDPSGLPIQWLLYWPLAIALQLGMAGCIAIYRRVKAMRSPPISTDATR